MLSLGLATVVWLSLELSSKYILITHYSSIPPKITQKLRFLTLSKRRRRWWWRRERRRWSGRELRRRAWRGNALEWEWRERRSLKAVAKPASANVGEKAYVVIFGVRLLDHPIAVTVHGLEGVDSSNWSVGIAVLREALRRNPAQGNLGAAMEDVQVDVRLGGVESRRLVSDKSVPACVSRVSRNISTLSSDQ
jgi:hypothetical protein